MERLPVMSATDRFDPSGLWVKLDQRYEVRPMRGWKSLLEGGSDGWGWSVTLRSMISVGVGKGVV